MLNSNATSKIVVGVGLAVALGVGVSVFAVHAKQQHAAEVAFNAPPVAVAPPTTQGSGDATAQPPSATAQTPVDQTAAEPNAAVSAPPVIVPADSSTRNAGASAKKRVKSTESQGDERNDRNSTALMAPVAPVAPAVSPMTNPTDDSTAQARSNPPSTDATPATPSANDLTSQPTPAGTEQGASVIPSTASATTVPAASDKQISADVKSEIASAAPNNNVDVTTTNGVVALAGSVPNQVAAEEARHAAQRVAGVRYVDTSALMVSNNQ